MKNSRVGLYIIGLWLALCITALVPARCFGYVLPAEQVIQFMAGNFSKLKTLVITHSIMKVDQISGVEIEVFKEQIWVKSPAFFRSKVLDENMERDFIPDSTYRRLLISNRQGNTMAFLSQKGIDVRVVELTRIDGVVAYRIGGGEPDTPKILVEKKRFLPLLLEYRLSKEEGGNMVKVRFQKYKKLEKGWFPSEITYSTDNGDPEKYAVLTIVSNTAIDPSILKSPELKPRPKKKHEEERALSDEDRLKKIINTFEEKYQ